MRIKRKMKNKIKTSIVICTCNGEKKIARAIESLLHQNYTKSKYEIIVVDDGSKDKTIEIVKKYPLIKLVRHKNNLGLANARNTGLKYAKGEIYVCFDDDCIANKNWLKELVKVYSNKKDVLGVGGWVINDSPKDISEEFIQEGGCGNPCPVDFIKSKNILYRFYTYLNSKIFPIEDKKGIFEVGFLAGANSSFFVKDLKEVRGWDIKLSGTEDTGLCNKLKKKNPHKIFYSNKSASLIHNHKLSFKDYLARPLKRGDKVLRFYKSQKKFPPIFPFPIAIILGSLISITFGIIPFLFSLIVLPQLFYFWFPIKFFKKLDKNYLVFPYMQFLLESFTILGLIKGYFLLNLKHHDSKK